MKPGIETVLDLIGLDGRLKNVSLVITGEGRLDGQSCFGKVVQGVGLRCKKHGIPAIALVGSTAEGAEKILEHGIVSIQKTAPDDMPLAEALVRAEELYFAAAVRLFTKIKNGEKL